MKGDEDEKISVNAENLAFARVSRPVQSGAGQQSRAR
jgi:hypothetical protein